MKYYVTFQELRTGAERPTDHPSASDFETDHSGFGMIPNVGDFVQIIRMRTEGAPRFDGKVKSRLFRYFENEACGVNIVVETGGDDDWGKLIKE